MGNRRLVALPLIALLCTVSAGAQTRVKITIGKDTTRITGPVRPDGTIDYLAAVNQLASKGVTKDNNAAVLILKAMGPDTIPEEIRARLLKLLGMRLPAKGDYFTDYSPATEADRAAYKKACANPWDRSAHPGLVRWLEANRGSLATFIAASKRSRLYVPYVCRPNRRGIDAAVIWVRPEMKAAKALAIRANLAVQEGRQADAWRDILAMYRIGALLGQDFAIVGQLIGVGIGEFSAMTTVNLATSGKLSAGRARAILAQLSSVGPGPDMLGAIDCEERFSMLDIIQEIAVDPVRAHGSCKGRLEAAPCRTVEGIQAYYRGVDFDQILRRANAYYDCLMAAMQKPTYAERVKAYKDIRAVWEGLRNLAQNPTEDKPVGRESPGTRRAGTRLLGHFLQEISRARVLADRTRVWGGIARLAISLAAYHADKGEYPPELGALAPAYIKAIPQDFFSGGPFVYKRQGRGYILYSVGDNARDDGGVWDRPERDDLVAEAER